MTHRGGERKGGAVVGAPPSVARSGGWPLTSAQRGNAASSLRVNQLARLARGAHTSTAPAHCRRRPLRTFPATVADRVRIGAQLSELVAAPLHRRRSECDCASFSPLRFNWCVLGKKQKVSECFMVWSSCTRRDLYVTHAPLAIQHHSALARLLRRRRMPFRCVVASKALNRRR